MAGKLQSEIKQTKPFRLIEEEAALNLWKTADALEQAMAGMLKPFGLSATQYNVLRILRGAAKDGLACGEIAGRMISRDPDITRLVDRLEARGLVTRSRDTKDRRVVTTRISDGGLKLLKDLDSPMDNVLRGRLAHLGQACLRQLIDLLEAAREPR